MIEDINIRVCIYMHVCTQKHIQTQRKRKRGEYYQYKWKANMFSGWLSIAQRLGTLATLQEFDLSFVPRMYTAVFYLPITCYSSVQVLWHLLTLASTWTHWGTHMHTLTYMHRHEKTHTHSQTHTKTNLQKYYFFVKNQPLKHSKSLTLLLWKFC